MTEEMAAQVVGKDDVFALEGLRRAVHGGDRSSQLMGNGCNEILELLQAPLLGQIAERVNSSFRRSGTRRPRAAKARDLGSRGEASSQDSGCSRSARDADGLRERVPQPGITSSRAPSTASAGTP